LDPRANPAKPAAADSTPPINNQIDLFVGDPVKNRDTSDPKESDALSP
jgi:hypothetical protein